MSILALAARVAMASVLFWAGLEKLRAPTVVVDVARRLGAPATVVPVVAPLLIILELATGAALLFRPEDGVTLLAVVVLAITFAAVGLIALRRGEQIRCGCFGAGSDIVLGRTQLETLPLWLAGAGILAVTSPSVNEPPPAFLFVAVALTMAGLRAAAALRAARAARADRRSAREMLVWLRR